MIYLPWRFFVGLLRCRFDWWFVDAYGLLMICLLLLLLLLFCFLLTVLVVDRVLSGSSFLVHFCCYSSRYRSGGFDCSVVDVAVAVAVDVFLVVAYEHFEDDFVLL